MRSRMVLLIRVSIAMFKLKRIFISIMNGHNFMQHFLVAKLSCVGLMEGALTFNPKVVGLNPGHVMKNYVRVNTSNGENYVDIVLKI